MKFEIKVGEHRPPYKRIDLNPLRVPTPAGTAEQVTDAFIRKQEIERGDVIWALIKKSAEGTAMPEPIEENDGGGT
jgi:hypothetical protein